MRTTIAAIFVLLCAAVAQADTCATIERWADGSSHSEWTTLEIPCGHIDDPGRVLITSAVVRNQGNWHYRWRSGSGVCVYTTSDQAGQHRIGGGRLLTIGNSNRNSPRGGTYFVAEVDAGYWTHAVAGSCVWNQIPTCFGRCGDYVRPGQEGVY